MVLAFQLRKNVLLTGIFEINYRYFNFIKRANIIIAAKTVKPHPKLPGTIFTAAKEIKDSGGTALPLEVDIRDEYQVKEAVATAVQKFGGIDILINNASAISPTGWGLGRELRPYFNSWNHQSLTSFGGQKSKVN